MDHMDTSSTHRPAGSPAVPSSDRAPKPSAVVPIREIGARYREQMLEHLLKLGERDRYLRFGYAATDAQVRRYVDTLDFARDQVFGIFNRKLELIAMAHLAYPVEQAAAGFAEFGVSVAPHARGRGYGSRLFERAAIHAVNEGVKTLYIHALSENTPMLRIVRKAGAVVERAGSESEAHLTLPEATFKSRLSELWAEQVANVDYFLKLEGKQLNSFVATAQEVREAVREGRHKSGS